MMTAKLEELKSELEALVDGSSLECVLEALSGVCADKSEHIITNWQDPSGARPWGKASNRLMRLAAQTDI